jgi:hypothetical protein
MNLVNIFSPLKILLIILLVGIFFSFHSVFAATPNIELDGYAWSSNIGWISLNCKTGGINGADICLTSSYRVTVNTTTNNVTGYAWSSNIGWIRFGGMGALVPNNSFPTGGGTTPGDAKVTGTFGDYTFTGWARACAGTLSPSGFCGNMNSRTDGWDGWISLDGTNYHVNAKGATGFQGTGSYAWGSDVVGWIDMSSYASWLFPTAVINGNACPVPLGQSKCDTTVGWTITNATTPIVKNGSTQISKIAVVPSSPVTLTLNTDTIIYAYDGVYQLASLLLQASDVKCVSPLIISSVDGTCQYPGPDITIRTDNSIVRSGDTVNVSWTISPTPLKNGVSCKVTGPISGTGNETGSRSADSSALTSKTAFTISCTGPFGSESKSATVQVVPKSQEV